MTSPPQKGRYIAEQMVEHPEREDCYIARLLVKEVRWVVNSDDNIQPSSRDTPDL